MLTQADIAAHLDLTQQTVSDLIRRGVLPRPHRGKACTLDVYRVGYIRHLREMAAGRASEDDSLDLVAERARLAKEQADAQAYKNALTRGDLLTWTQAEMTWEKVLTALRTRLLAIPSKAAVLLVAMTTAAETQGALTALIYEALQELADGGAALGAEVAAEFDTMATAGPVPS